MLLVFSCLRRCPPTERGRLENFQWPKRKTPDALRCVCRVIRKRGVKCAFIILPIVWAKQEWTLMWSSEYRSGMEGCHHFRPKMHNALRIDCGDLDSEHQRAKEMKREKRMNESKICDVLSLVYFQFSFFSHFLFHLIHFPLDNFFHVLVAFFHSFSHSSISSYSFTPIYLTCSFIQHSKCVFFWGQPLWQWLDVRAVVIRETMVTNLGKISVVVGIFEINGRRVIVC